MTENNRQLSVPDLKLALTTGSGLPSFHMPDVKEPTRGRDGINEANEMRRKYFRLWHNMVLAKLGIASSLLLGEYAQEILDGTINRMVARYLHAEREPAAMPVMNEITEVCINNLAAQVRAILETYPRRLGEII